MSSTERPPVLVVGDVCLDIVNLPIPSSSSADSSRENWRQAGELRTHYLPGGAMLLADFVRAARKSARGKEPDTTSQSEAHERASDEKLDSSIAGPQPLAPSLSASPKTRVKRDVVPPLDKDAFLRLAPRLRREEILHSIMGAEQFPLSADPAEKKTTPRVRQEYGYSGPDDGVPALTMRYGATGKRRVVVISDTGNQFRRTKAGDLPRGMLDDPVCVVYKLHKPLPDRTGTNALWDLVKSRTNGNYVTIVDINDVRAAEIPISEGLSWERTALDIVWHLLNVERLSELRDCSTLVIRLGLDGALLWRRLDDPAGPPFRAAIVYDPDGIEGAFASGVPGRMVAYGSAFTAAVVEAVAEEAADRGTAKKLKPASDDAIISGIKSGLLASRRLLTIGFVETPEHHLTYPGLELFAAPSDKDARFAHAGVPIIREAIQPDRGYWRVLESIFQETARLEEAVELVASKRKGVGALKTAEALLDASPRARFGALTTYDRREIEHYRSLYTLLRDYLAAPNPPRPLSIAVFGAPGAGKSFGVKEVAKALKGQPGCKEVEALTFNLSLFHSPQDLAGAFHLVRDIVLRGRMPLVFFDEFDTTLDGPLGWLRHFLSPMQDGEFLDREAPHPIGPAIFVFAGGTCATYAKFEDHASMTAEQFAGVKGPDFISRLRATLDIPTLNLAVAFHEDVTDGEGSTARAVAELLKSQGLEHYDPFGPVEEIPSRAAVVLRRAGILAFNLPKKAPGTVRADKSLSISRAVLRVLMHLPQFRHGNRSFEALLDMSHLGGATVYTPALFPAPFQTILHADARQLSQLVATDYPFPAHDREAIAKSIHKYYLADNRENEKKTKAYRPWEQLAEDDRQSNFEQADDIAVKLRTAGLWFRKRPAIGASAPEPMAATLSRDLIEMLAVLEHDRWVAQKRRQGWAAAETTAGESRKNDLLLHNCLFPWKALSKQWWDLDRQTISRIPIHLAAAGYEIIKP